MRAANSPFNTLTASGMVWPVLLSSPEKKIPKGDTIRSPIRQITSTMATTVLPPAAIAASKLWAAAMIARSARPAACAVFCTAVSAVFVVCCRRAICMAASLAACVPAAVAWAVEERTACSADCTADLPPSRTFGMIPAACSGAFGSGSRCFFGGWMLPRSLILSLLGSSLPRDVGYSERSGSPRRSTWCRNRCSACLRCTCWRDALRPCS